MNRRAWFGIFAVVAIAVTASDSHAQLRDLFRRGPSIETISTKELSTMLQRHQQSAQKTREAGEEVEPVDFVVVDVRSEAETKVSVIPGAITKVEFEKDREKYNGRTVIPYCTVGGRSGAYAQQLANDGVKVKNYKGSILDWVNNELPLVTLDGKPTNRVHTYSAGYRVPSKYQAVH